jgi:hypothetical protein
MFDFYKGYLAPEEQVVDTHHLAVQIWNASAEEAAILLRIGSAELYTWLPPERGITITDEESQRILIENRSTQTLTVEWRKTRD